MRPYLKDKDRNKPKFEKKKLNKKTGHLTSIDTSKLEAKNANRSRKKGVRQEGKKETKYDLFSDEFDDFGEEFD